VEYVDTAALPTVRTVQMYGTPGDGSPIDNVAPGAIVTCLATITGVEGPGPFEYLYQHRHKGDSNWELAQDWSPSDNLVWSTAEYEPGVAYELRTSVRPVNSTTLLGMATMPLTMATGAATGLILNDPSLASPQLPGVSVGWTATASGGTAPYEYQYQLYNYTTATWSMGKAYADPGGNAWTWNTSGLPAGLYFVNVWARSAGSTATFEVSAGAHYQLE
jgi:hypothetical protein